MSGFQEMFADLLDARCDMPAERVAQELARYHHYRTHNGMTQDPLVLDALAGRGYLAGADLANADLSDRSRADRMTFELIGAVMECLKDGRALHSAMLCGLTACASRITE